MQSTGTERGGYADALIDAEIAKKVRKGFRSNLPTVTEEKARQLVANLKGVFDQMAVGQASEELNVQVEAQKKNILENNPDMDPSVAHLQATLSYETEIKSVQLADNIVYSTSQKPKRGQQG